MDRLCEAMQFSHGFFASLPSAETQTLRIGRSLAKTVPLKTGPRCCRGRYVAAHENWCSPFFFLVTNFFQLFWSTSPPTFSTDAASCFFSRLCRRSSSWEKNHARMVTWKRPRPRHHGPVSFCAQSLALLQLGGVQWCPEKCDWRRILYLFLANQLCHCVSCKVQQQTFVDNRHGQCQLNAVLGLFQDIRVTGKFPCQSGDLLEENVLRVDFLELIPWMTLTSYYIFENRNLKYLNMPHNMPYIYNCKGASVPDFRQLSLSPGCNNNFDVFTPQTKHKIHRVHNSLQFQNISQLLCLPAVALQSTSIYSVFEKNCSFLQPKQLASKTLFHLRQRPTASGTWTPPASSLEDPSEEATFNYSDVQKNEHVLIYVL